MKTIIIGFAIAAAALTACNNGDKSKETTKSSDTTQTTGQAPVTATKAASATELVANYLQLKNALTNDNGKDAATACKALSETVQKVDEGSLTAGQKKVFDDVKDDIKENAEHISTNGGKIAHQREHFDMLSKDMYDVVKAFGSGQTLYQDHCPMYNDGKGANWLSEVKEIKNPYLGKKMPNCGTVKEEIKQ
jgi:predicted small secreted protein